MSGSAFYQTFFICAAFTLPGLKLTDMEILTVYQIILFSAVFIFVAWLRNQIDNRSKKSSKEVFFTHIYHFYISVTNYVKWYDSDHAPRFIKEQKQFLDELEKYIEISGKKLTSRVVKQANYFKKRLNEIVSDLWANARHSDQAKRYEVWKNIKYNVMENEIKTLYEQLRKVLK